MAPALTIGIPATGHEARLAARTNTWDAPTCGIAPGHLQANLIVLPNSHAHDFEILCARNPVPCPLLAKSARPGDFSNLISYMPGISDADIAAMIDIRTDAPRYNVYVDGKLSEEGISDVRGFWTKDHVAFLIGCSYSFETALTNAGLTPPHILHGRNVAMYRTKIPLCPAGKFQTGSYVVSMRMYHAEEVERVREITRPYVATHGESIAWGWDGARSLGIEDVSVVQWGDVPVSADGKEVEQDQAGDSVPVFWGCGVTPQEAVVRAKVPGSVIGHAPGYMLVLDVREEDVLGKRRGPPCSESSLISSGQN